MRNKTKFMSGNAGFTLIELIVVIAILAILGGIGTVGYSAYVDKANEAADRQMISDIEQALILGAYANRYAPGTTVGAVGVSQEAEASVEGDVEAMMVNAFGENWSSSLKLRGDHYTNSDSGRLIAAIQAAQIKDKNVFDSVPGSSFYKGEGSTTELVDDVDEIAGALTNVLEGIGETGFDNFWGLGFHESVGNAGLTDTWKDSEQAAANLTVFAAANGISNADDDTQKEWTDAWADPGLDQVVIENGYVADLVMNYAQCVALNNYVKQQNPGDYAMFFAGYYNDLETAMQNMKDSTDYLGDFNKALDDFWIAMGTDNVNAWQAKPEGGKSQAEIDAEAFMASMAAINSMEGNYVNKNQTTLLSTPNAFKQAEADKVLDTMVSYCNMTKLPDTGEYVIVLSIAADGTPIVTPTLQKD